MLQNATYPYARLSVSPEELELRVLAVVYRFRPDQVRAIEVVRAAPVIGRGIRIHHDVPGYPRLMVFWTLGNPSALAAQLREFGFGNDPTAVYEPTDFSAERAVGTAIGVMWVIFAAFALIPAAIVLIVCLGCCGVGLFSGGGGGGSPSEVSSPRRHVTPEAEPTGSASTQRGVTDRGN